MMAGAQSTSCFEQGCDVFREDSSGLVTGGRLGGLPPQPLSTLASHVFLSISQGFFLPSSCPPQPASLVLFCSLPRAPYLLQVTEVPRPHCISEEEKMRVCVCVCVCVCVNTRLFLSPHLFTNYWSQTENSTGGSIFSLGSPWLLNSAAHSNF